MHAQDREPATTANRPGETHQGRKARRVSEMALKEDVMSKPEVAILWRYTRMPSAGKPSMARYVGSASKIYIQRG